MRFGVLGPVTAWTDGGEPVTIPGLKVRALLADLLLHEGRPVPADRLIDDLWGDDLPGNPGGTLSAKVSQLRRAFEDAEPGSRTLVVSGPAGYSVKVDSDSYDALQFQSFLEQGRLEDALALWRGPAYADFADEAFVETTVARLTEQRLTAQEQYYESRGDNIGELADLVARHPLRERLRAAYIKALYRAGRQSEALDSYEQLRVLLSEELGLDPSPELVALQQAILTQELPQRRSNLPAQLTDLVGRADAVAEIQARLPENRLLTLTGPGGVGKTRLALAVAEDLAGSFADGVTLVELAAVSPDALDVTSSLTDALQVALDLREAGPGEAAVDRLAAVMGDRLLVLDNCEHVIDEAAALTDRLLGAAPGLRVLATSREPLGLAGEAVWTVPTLVVPGVSDSLEALQSASAVELFVARAAAADRAFKLDESTAPAVSVLCRRLDGIPLALELAATRVRALGVTGLVARLDDRFRLLATGHRGAAPRQQTLMAMIDWSWDLLSSVEQTVLRRLAVHADGCTADAAEQVCAVDDDVLDILVRLVDRSLVVAVHGTDGPRYRLLESVAAYCVEKLHEAGEYEAVRSRHRLYYVEFAERARPGLYGAEQALWLQRLDDETGNLRSALDGCVAAGEVSLAQRLVDALAWYWFLRGRVGEARRSLEAVPETPALAAWLAGFMYLQGDSDAAAVRARCVAEVDARALWWLAFTGVDSGDLVVCLELLERCLASFDESGDRWGRAAVLAARAKHAHVHADLVALRGDAEESARLFRELGDRWGLLQAIGWLGALAELTSDFAEAARLHTEGLQMAEELGLWPDVAGEYGWLGWTAIREGDYAKATTYGEQAYRLATEQGHRPTQSLGEIVLGFAARRSGDLDVAEKRLRTLIDAARRQDEPVLYLSMVLVELGFTLELRGELLEARQLHAEAFRLSRDYESRRSMCWALEGLAATLAVDEPAIAARLLGTAARFRTADGFEPSDGEATDADRAAAAARVRLGAAYDTEYEAELTMEEAYALVPGV
ncbi:putative ATPase [Kribbella sp. VKM Ac-2527]|uniref:Putative ATPase n=1 Tax=Kribbella caucasensis TaxID=2512215 RepID=A0A4R6JKL4_9ACTN|nr:BTAD domain-containing putative transcriptional regulator [Kribbella sp. VKM Ac-2527]TDO35246.1 putative ATPase [Kribbella sp. VKM Ac-2527]